MVGKCDRPACGKWQRRSPSLILTNGGSSTGAHKIRRFVHKKTKFHDAAIYRTWEDMRPNAVLASIYLFPGLFELFHCIGGCPDPSPLLAPLIGISLEP